MKNNKYYTPTIEEFHVGFEYEYLTNGDDQINHTINNKADLVDCIEDLEENKVRVKHLDQEDIESFRFKFTGRTIDDWYKLEGNFEIPMSNHRNMQIRLQHDFRTHQGVRIVGYEFDENSDSETFYRGSCKNKSELKRILTQIKVI